MKAGIIPFLIIIWVLSRIISKSKGAQNKNKAQNPAARPAAQRQAPSVQLNRPVPSMQRPPVTAAGRSAHRDFRAPEAPCIVCEQTGDDHFQRDKARRIAQLDDWLKNGIIDKDEYRVMKDRYQRGI
jgi:hypothetical protein